MADLENIEHRLERIEDLLQSLQMRKQQKYFYTTNEAAERLGRST